jgi:hypothetical protein
MRATSVAIGLADCDSTTAWINLRRVRRGRRISNARFIGQGWSVVLRAFVQLLASSRTPVQGRVIKLINTKGDEVMKKIVLSMATMTAALCTSFEAGANNCPAECSGELAASSNAANPAIYGTNSNHAGWGVYGEDTAGVGGNQVGGTAIHGGSTYGNGVVGQNNRTDSNAAAIAAIAGSDNGMAYWGTGGIQVTGTASKPGGGQWANSSSDERVKKDVKAFHQGLPELRQIRLVSYRYNGLGGTSDDGKEYVGVIAQDLEKILPDMVGSRKGKLRQSDDHETDIKTVDLSNFTYILINAVQEQQKVIDRQDGRITTLERGGRAPLMSSLVSGGLGGVALGLLPLGLIARRRRVQED